MLSARVAAKVGLEKLLRHSQPQTPLTNHTTQISSACLRPASSPAI